MTPPRGQTGGLPPPEGRVVKCAQRVESLTRVLPSRQVLGTRQVLRNEHDANTSPARRAGRHAKAKGTPS
jgi:hypothetical protein